jgi:hypothetical protein
MQAAIRLRLDGATIREAQAYLNRNGVEISYRGLQSAFASKLLVGRIEYGGEVNVESFDQVIDPETFGQLQRVRATRGRRPKSDRLLARLRILRCGTCGDPAPGRDEQDVLPDLQVFQRRLRAASLDQRAGRRARGVRVSCGPG